MYCMVGRAALGFVREGAHVEAQARRKEAATRQPTVV
jgi:hypothetical protein